MIKARTFDQVSAERAEAEPTPETNACIAAIRGKSLEGLCKKLERERDKLKHDVERLKTMSVCELGAHNSNIHGYLEHWENRALKAERELEESNARVAVLEEEQRILGAATLGKSLRGTTATKAAVIEGADNPSLPSPDGEQAGRERPEPSPHLSETPQTDAKVRTFEVPTKFGRHTRETCMVHIDFARKLERERDEAWAHRVAVLRKERDEQTAQMCQAIGYLSTIAEDCEAWLNGESDEPSMEFIKAVRDYARKAVNNA